MVEAKKASTTVKKTASASKSTAAKPAAKTTKPVAKSTTKSAASASSTTSATKSAAKKTSASAKKSSLLKLHHLKPAPGAKTDKTRVGRGEASKGKTAGRGTKGTKARYQVKVGFEGGQMPLHMRLPKLRGFKNPFRTEYQVVNLDRLSKVFPKGGKIGIEDLILKGLVRPNFLVKVLGDGEALAAFEITADKFSASAVKKIEKASGKAILTVKEEK